MLLCLFAGEATKFTLHEKPQMIHFGFPFTKSNVLTKPLRDKDGNERVDKLPHVTSFSKKNPPEYSFYVEANSDQAKGRIDVQGLYNAIRERLKLTVADFDVAHFADK